MSSCYTSSLRSNAILLVMDMQAHSSLSQWVNVNVYTIYPHHKQTHPECQLHDLLPSVLSLRNNWDWYNLLKEQIWNQHSQHKVHVVKMINIPFIKHHGRVPERSYYKPNPPSWNKRTQHKLLFNKETLQRKQPKWTGLTVDIWN